MAYGLHVFCANFNDNSDLIRAFKVLRDYQVQTVLLHGLKFTEVFPRDLFEGLEISEIRVEKSKLKFSQPAFSGLDESLHTLNVEQQSMIKSSEGFSIARLTKLTKLTIKANSLKIVKNDWLNDKIPNVHTIVLDDDEISEVEDKAFANFSKLKSIYMADNYIKSISRSMFPRPTVLTKIDLSGNQISSLPYDIFFDMPDLTEVIFTGNDLDTLPERTWISIWEQLEKVILLENSLVCDENLDWLKNVRWPSTVTAECHSPADKKGKTLMQVYNT